MVKCFKVKLQFWYKGKLRDVATLEPNLDHNDVCIWMLHGKGEIEHNVNLTENFRLYFHPDSLGIFKPQENDIGLYLGKVCEFDVDRWYRSHVEKTRDDTVDIFTSPIPLADTVEITMRDQTQFFMPKKRD
jgi:hypothetical protein